MSTRVRRVSESVRGLLAEGLGDLKDPRIGFVTLTDVRMSPDLRHAEVFYTTLPDDADELERTAAGLASATPILRRDLGARLRLRHVPELRFSHDPLPEQGRRIDRLIEGHDADGGD